MAICSDVLFLFFLFCIGLWEGRILVFVGPVVSLVLSILKVAEVKTMAGHFQITYECLGGKSELKMTWYQKQEIHKLASVSNPISGVARKGFWGNA